MRFIDIAERAGMEKDLLEGIEALLEVRFGAEGLKLGQAKKLGLGNVRSSNGSTVAVEVLVGLDGKVLYPRVVSAPAKTGDAAIAAAKQWEFEPSTFEGHAVQVIETISFPVK